MDVGKGREQERKLRLHAQAKLALPLQTVVQFILCSFLKNAVEHRKPFALSVVEGRTGF